MALNHIQSTSNFITLYLTTYQLFEPLYFLNIFTYFILHSITILYYILSYNLVHSFKLHPINFILFHNIFIHLPFIFTTLLFKNIYSFHLAFNNNITYLFIL